MLPIYIPPTYKGISVRPVMLPRDVADLIAIHIRNDYGASSSFQPTPATIELLYGRFLDWPSYGVYLVSDGDTTLFLLELIPVDHTDLGNYYEVAFFDYSIEIKLGVDLDRKEPVERALSGSLEGVFVENQSIYRLVMRVGRGEMDNRLLQVLGKVGFRKLDNQIIVGGMVIYGKWR